MTVEQFLYHEARYLDDREFDKWLECYAPDSEFWMPAWDDDDTLVTDPEREISLIYYNNRGGLEALPDRPHPGRAPILSRDQEVRLLERIDAPPRPEDGVCELRGADIRRILEQEFEARYSQSGVYSLAGPEVPTITGGDFGGTPRGLEPKGR